MKKKHKRYCGLLHLVTNSCNCDHVCEDIKKIGKDSEIESLWEILIKNKGSILVGET